MQLSFFDYTACIHPASSLNAITLKEHAQSRFLHNDVAHTACLISTDSSNISFLKNILSTLLQCPGEALRVTHKLCYKHTGITVLGLPTMQRSFLIAYPPKNRDPVEQGLNNTLLNVLDYYRSLKLRFDTAHCYTDKFPHYMGAQDIKGVISHWVSPTSTLKDTFKITASSQNPTSQITYESNTTSLAIAPLNEGHVKQLNAVMDHTLGHFDENSNALHLLTSLKSNLLDIARADAHGDLSDAFNTWVTNIVSHQTALKESPRRKPYTPVTKDASTRSFSNMFKGKPIKTCPLPLPTRSPNPIQRVLHNLQKQLNDISLSHLFPTPQVGLSSVLHTPSA